MSRNHWYSFKPSSSAGFKVLLHQLDPVGELPEISNLNPTDSMPNDINPNDIKPNDIKPNDI